MMISEEKRQKFAYDREIASITAELAKKKTKPGEKAKTKQDDKKKARERGSMSVTQSKIMIPDDCEYQEEVRSTKNGKNPKTSHEHQDQ